LVVTASAAPAADPTDGFYDPATVQTIYLEIKAQDLERMHRALPQRICVPGTFRWKDQKFEEVGVRYKGNSSSAPDSPHKRSFLIAFSEYRSGQRFMGLRHVALDNGIQFGSLFSERLITDVLRGLDVKASRCNFARVFLNQTNAGIYVNVERIDKSFLQRHFKADKGPLFKVELPTRTFSNTTGSRRASSWRPGFGRRFSSPNSGACMPRSDPTWRKTPTLPAE
jgi:spore coat protein CotH